MKVGKIKMPHHLGAFLRAKLKDRSMRVDEFLYRSRISRSSFYRILNGTQCPSADIASAITATLNLTGNEEIEFQYYMSLMNVDENTLSAREEITDMLFGTRDTVEEISHDVILYDGDRYLRTVSDIFASVEAVSGCNGFSCTVRMVNCCKLSIISEIKEALLKIEKSGHPCSIEHLIGFSDANLKESVNVLRELLPLLTLKNYSVRCGENTASTSEGMMKNFVLIDYSWEDESGVKQNKQLCINFLDDSASVCMAVSDSGLSDFLNRSYDNLRRFYISGLIVKKQLQTFSARIIDMEAHYDIVLFKPDPCDSRVPYAAFEHLRNRVTLEDKVKFVKTFVGVEPKTEAEAEKYMDQTFLFLAERERNSSAHTQTDICTKDGLRRFAETGSLSDHVDFIPPFDKTERRMILESMINRLSDADEKYKLYILRNNYASPDMLMVVYKENGLLIENINHNYSTSEMPHCFIEHPGLANAFVSFAESEIPTRYAIPHKETVAFLQSLIDEYCKD